MQTATPGAIGAGAGPMNAIHPHGKSGSIDPSGIWTLMAVNASAWKESNAAAMLTPRCASGSKPRDQDAGYSIRL